MPIHPLCSYRAERKDWSYPTMNLLSPTTSVTLLVEYAGNRVLRHLWRTGKTGPMDVVMKDAIASSLLLSTTPSGTCGATTLITAHLCVSLPAGDRGKSKGSSLVSLAIPFSICVRDANFAHAFLTVINGSTLRLTCRTISNTAGD